MTQAPDRELACRNCNRPHPADQLDRNGWCGDCRALVIARARLIARIAGAIGALAAIAVIFATITSTSRFLVAWGLLVAAVYFIVYKLVQRVAFEVIRSRGVPPPKA